MNTYELLQHDVQKAEHRIAELEAELKRLTELCRQQQLQIDTLQGVDPHS